MKIRSLRPNTSSSHRPRRLQASSTGSTSSRGERVRRRSTLARQSASSLNGTSKAASVVANAASYKQDVARHSLEFELPTGLHRIEKRFCQGPYARSRCQTAPFTTASGRGALQRISNFTQAGKNWFKGR